MELRQFRIKQRFFKKNKAFGDFTADERSFLSQELYIFVMYNNMHSLYFNKTQASSMANSNTKTGRRVRKGASLGECHQLNCVSPNIPMLLRM